MSNTPSVAIVFSNGNLLQNIPAIDGQAAFIGTGSTNANLNKVFTVSSLEDAESQGITANAEPAAHFHLKEFYGELAGNQEVFLLLVDNGTTMAGMLDSTVADKAEKLITAGAGKIGYLGVFRKPPVGYDPGDDFFDVDVPAAVTAAKTFVQKQNTKLRFFRVLIEGRIAVETSNTIYAPNTASNGFAGVVLGSSQNDLGASVGLLLGRKVKYQAHIKVGKVANGPLSVTQIYIGTKQLTDVANLDALHGKGVISFVTYPNKAGFYFGIDRMATTDDYRLLAYGAVVDAAARVVASVYIDELEGEVDTQADGTVTDDAADFLEARLRQQVGVTLANRISGFLAVVNRTVNIINTSKTMLKARVRPVGYKTWIEVDLGLTAGN